MKNLFILLLFVLSASASAQYYGADTPGVNRAAVPQHAQPKKKPLDKKDMVEMTVKKIDEELTLDNFQKAVITQIIEKNQGEQDKIIALDIPDESKYEKMTTLREQGNVEIKKVLTPVQIEKFDKLTKKKKK